jgi:hypothetical protein
MMGVAMAMAPPAAAQAVDPAIRVVSVDWGDAPPGYDEPLPATHADWEVMHQVLRGRVLRAERQLGKVRRSRDEAEIDRVEDELDARKDALRAFVERTTRRRPELWVPGVTLMGGGVLGLLLFAHSNIALEETQDRGVSVPGAGIAGLVGLAGGSVLLGVGLRRTWRGPADDRPVVGVGPGSLTVRGAF